MAKSSVPVDVFREDEAERVHAWRVSFCLDLGYSLPMAERIAWSPADLHLLTRLLDQGCPKVTAARIVV